MDDHPLRWKCVSRTRCHVEHVMELGHFKGNGSCTCEDFQFNFFELLSKGITPEEALARKLIPIGKKRADKKPEDALRCEHLIEARGMYADAMIKSMDNNEKTHALSKGNAHPSRP